MCWCTVPTVPLNRKNRTGASWRQPCWTLPAATLTGYGALDAWVSSLLRLYWVLLVSTLGALSPHLQEVLLWCRDGSEPLSYRAGDLSKH